MLPEVDGDQCVSSLEKQSCTGTKAKQCTSSVGYEFNIFNTLPCCWQPFPLELHFLLRDQLFASESMKSYFPFIKNRRWCMLVFFQAVHLKTCPGHHIDFTVLL